MTNDKNPQKKPLPWWVELLFVQIGLPDRWLRSFLKSRKRANIFLSTHKRDIGKLGILIIALVYLYPIINRAKLHNTCIYDSKRIVKSTKGNQGLNEREIRALATNFCNGGYQ